MTVDASVKSDERELKGSAQVLPAPNSDFFEFADTSAAEEYALLKKALGVHGGVAAWPHWPWRPCGASAEIPPPRSPRKATRSSTPSVAP